MSDIKFNCPQCGQHLTVAASGANATVACPKCGQAIIVPSLARVAQPEPPKPGKWWGVAAGVVVVAFLAAGVLIWQKHQPLTAQTKPTPAKRSAKNVTAQPASPEQQVAKVKERWSKAFNDARQDFLNSNDSETADFCGNILASLDQPDGSSPAALAAQVERIKKQVRDLVRRDALESAARLNWAQCAVLFPIRDDAEPAHPNHKTGGTPGPGGLVLYLPFDAPDENGVVHDASGAGNDGHVYGAKWIPEGKFGGAYQFSITNLTDRIVIPNSDLLNPDYITGRRLDQNGGHGWILESDRGQRVWRKGFMLDLGGDWEGKTYRGRPTFELLGGLFQALQSATDTGIMWQAPTMAGSKIYLDGVERGQKKAGHPGPIGKNNWDLCVGNRVMEDSLGDFVAYDGLIDEVRIYNRALSADEIKALATADKPNP